MAMKDGVNEDRVVDVDSSDFFFFSSRRRHTRFDCDWSSDVCSSDLRDDWKEELRRRVESLDPVCVGISSLTGIQLRTAMEAAREVKRLSADLPVVWGGVHASLLPLETMREDFVDFVVVGEGELTFTELVKCLDQGKTPHDVMGIWYKDD